MCDDRQRLDKWLWYARIVKTRNLAAKLVLEGYVRVNAVRTRASQPVRAGDVLTIALGHTTLVLEVLAFGTRRGPAEEARKLYRQQLSST